MGAAVSFLDYPADGDWDAVRRNFQSLDTRLAVLLQIPFFTGSGTPEAAVTASPPAIYFNQAGGTDTTLYVKASGSATNTGWLAVDNV
jgi:hypothetical protein